MGQPIDYDIAEAPDWIENIDAEYDIQEIDELTSAYYYLLVDKQYDIERQQDFIHVAIVILNAEGLREVSDITVEYDPSYQELVFHKINIIQRDTVWSQLDHSQIRVVEAEPDMERYQYDRHLTAVVHLKNIQIGDIIEYAYSIKGYNPVFEGHYSCKLYLQFAVPIQKYFVRLITPKRTHLQLKYFNEAAQPKLFQSGDNNIYVWKLTNIPQLLSDINTPLWYDPYPHVAISDYTSWQSVVEWCMRLFDVNTNNRLVLKDKARDMFDHASIDTTIIQVIRFVQDNIRYLSYSNGLYSYKPQNPIRVLEQRYGDCKDKALLLSELLRAFDIEAFPLFVSSTNGYTLEDYPPSLSWFDHCVVHFRKNDTSYYVDPTISSQGGDLSHLYFPIYHKGLVIRKEENDLSDLPMSSYASTSVTETYTLNELGNGATLDVITSYKGADADIARRQFATIDKNVIQHNYTEFYASLYPTIEIDREMVITDIRDGINEFIVDEYYFIDSLWHPSMVDEQIIIAEFYPLSFEDAKNVTRSPARSMPFWVEFPVDVMHEIIIKLPEEWNVTGGILEVDDESFSYTSSISYNDSTVTAVYRYKTYKSFIEAEAVAGFCDKHDLILNDLSLYLQYDKSVDESSFSFSWIIALCAIISLVLSAYYAAKIYRRYDIDVTIDINAQAKIRGWLLFFGIGLTLAPFKVLYVLVTSPGYFDNNVWNQLFNIDTSIRNLLTGLLMIVELLYNVAIFIFSCLVVALFYSKRTILPRLLILYIMTTLVFTIIDTIVAWNLNPAYYTDADLKNTITEIIRTSIYAMIWIPYFLVSKRVKRTFVKKSQRNRTSVE